MLSWPARLSRLLLWRAAATGTPLFVRKGFKLDAESAAAQRSHTGTAAAAAVEADLATSCCLRDAALRSVMLLPGAPMTAAPP